MSRIRRYLDPLNYLRLVESVLLWKDIRSEKPQLFILGLPRSGTTLVYQYIVHRLRVSYFTEHVGRYPHSALLMTWWDRRRSGEYRSDFKSRYGKMTGPVVPREAGGFWSRFFDPEGYTRAEDLSPSRIRVLRRTVAGAQRVFGNVPFVNKNVKHMLRLDALQEIYPRSIFLIVERDLEDVALSLLRARRANREDPREWWSVRPPDHETLSGLPLPRQVAGQIRGLAARMETDLERVPAGRVMRTGYESFCQDPEDLLGRLRPLLGDPADNNPPEAGFPVSRNTAGTPEEHRLLELLRT